MESPPQPRTATDGTSTGDVSGVGVAIGTGASVRIYGDVHYAPVRLHAAQRRVFDPLIEDRTALFVGRDDVLATIGDWVRGDDPGYLVVTAPAGFGKTALLANVIAQTPDAFAYHFFTSAYGPDGLAEHFFLANVVEQIAAWHARKGEPPEALPQLRALYHELLGEEVERRQILVVDGLDEVTSWDLSQYLSRRLRGGLRVILGIRDSGQDWRRQYALPAAQVRHVPLDGLSRADAASVFELAGGAARELAGDDAFLDDLARAATPDGGAVLDPFYVRLLAEDYANARLTRESGIGPPTGLDDYLRDWWEEVRQAAGDEPARDLFGTLTAAVGPLLREELEAINPSLNDSWQADFLDDLVERVRRLVVGDASTGYSLIHPRLRTFMTRQIRLEQYTEKLLAYCDGWREHQSPYPFAHYAEHLDAADRTEDLYTLLSVDWLRTKLARTASPRSLARDLELGIRTARRRRDVGHECRISLLHGAIAETASDIPPEALEALAELGQVDRAEGYARLITDHARRSGALALIGRVVARRSAARAEDFFEAALRAAEQIELATTRAEALNHLARVLIASGMAPSGAKLAEQAAKAADDVWYDWGRARFMLDAAQVLLETGDGASAARRAEHVVELASGGDLTPAEKAAALVEAGCLLEITGDEKRSGAVFGLAQPALEGPEGVYGEEAARIGIALSRAGAVDAAATWCDSAFGWDAVTVRAAVAEAFLAAGDRSQADALADAAIAKAGDEPIRTYTKASEVADALRPLTGLLLALDRPDDAVALARGNTMPYVSATCLGVIATGLAREGDRDRAHALVEEVVSRRHGRARPERSWSGFHDVERADSEARRAIASALSTAGRHEAALAMAGSIRSRASRLTAHCEIADRLMQVGRLDEARTVVRSARPADLAADRYRLDALGALAGTLVRLGETGDALLLSRAVDKTLGGALRLLLIGATTLLEVGESEAAAALADDVAAQAEILSRPDQDSSEASESAQSRELLVALLAGLGRVDDALALVGDGEQRIPGLTALVVALERYDVADQRAAKLAREVADLAGRGAGDPYDRVRDAELAVRALRAAGLDHETAEPRDRALRSVRTVLGAGNQP